jgi:flagellar hook assembly protein FlgD
LPKSGNAEVKIYDALGKEISTLVTEKLSPGVYSVNWDGTDYPSGVYFYKLITGDYAETRKMVLIKEELYLISCCFNL